MVSSDLAISNSVFRSQVIFPLNCLFILLFCLQNAYTCKNGYNLLVLFEGSIWFYMQVVLSIDSTKVTGVSENTISDLYYPCQKNSILSMCYLNKPITTLNQSVSVAVFVTFTF